MAIPKANRGWRQYGLRALLAVAVLLAIPCSWLAVKAKRQQAVVQSIRELGGRVEWSKPSGPAWLRDLLGDDFFRHVEAVDLEGTQATDATLAALTELNQVQRLELCHTKITDAALESLLRMKEPAYLDLSATRVTDAGEKKLRQALPDYALGSTATGDEPLTAAFSTPPMLELYPERAEMSRWSSGFSRFVRAIAA